MAYCVSTQQPAFFERKKEILCVHFFLSTFPSLTNFVCQDTSRVWSSGPVGASFARQHSPEDGAPQRSTQYEKQHTKNQRAQWKKKSRRANAQVWPMFCLVPSFAIPVSENPNLLCILSVPIRPQVGLPLPQGKKQKNKRGRPPPKCTRRHRCMHTPRGRKGRCSRICSVGINVVVVFADTTPWGFSFVSSAHAGIM
nr:hypothetical protein [Pandoravirus massiliensis]